MERNNKKMLVLYLTDWQMRMVNDFLGVKCHTLEVPIDDEPVLRYGIRPGADSKMKKMYLTDWQKCEMMDETGSVCNFVELDSRMVGNFKYKMPPE